MTREQIEQLKRDMQIHKPSELAYLLGDLVEEIERLRGVLGEVFNLSTEATIVWLADEALKGDETV